MLVFYHNLGPNQAGGPTWFIGPLILLIPLLLQLFGAGVFALPFQLLSLLFGGGAVFSSTAYVYEPGTGWRQVSGSSSSGGGLFSLFGALLLAGLAWGLWALVRQARREGVGPALRTLRRALFTGWQGGGGGAAGQPGGQQAQQRGGAARAAGTHAERWERVTQLVQALPAEVHRSREELEGLPVGELKALARKAGVKLDGQGGAAPPLEKHELIDALLSGANSSSASCSICCDDYAPGDILRALPCGHRFHLPCIDRWLLSSTDYSRPPACPMCNAELAAPGEQRQEQQAAA